uniref:Transposase, Ptta/En/Spm n=1 Tax=Tanacetum cinerariifolium TaxID=118510 RepID=A0A6L2KBK1_TANCI|nr:transposase, Ptta/En/Spm [Tanacetum cinerariifolium]
MAKVKGEKIYATVREEDKKEAKKAKGNWAKTKMVQVTAKKTYARVREELKECLTGNELTRKELFRVCFSKDTGL